MLVWLRKQTVSCCLVGLLGKLSVVQCPHRSQGARMGTLEVI